MTPPAAANSAVEGAARLSLASNFFLVLVKIAAGFLSGSISVLAEGFQSTMDVVASALILFTIRAAARPPDRSHPYGHGKFEHVASLLQMVLILGTSAFVLAAAWERWREPVMPRLDLGIGALSLSVVVNLAVSARLTRVARRAGSQALEAEATHLRTDLLSCLGVLLGLGGVALTGNPRLDPVVAAVMTLFVIFTALQLLRDSLRPLLDERLPPDEEHHVLAVLHNDPRVLGFHKLRTRRSGAHRHIDVHILLDDALSFSGAHRIGEEVEGKIRAVLPNTDIIVHAEPYHEETRHQQEKHGPA